MRHGARLGGNEEQRREQRMRASAWSVLYVCIVSIFAQSIHFRYYYGYEKDKQAFAWLGERCLNEIKACTCRALAHSAERVMILSALCRVVKRQQAAALYRCLDSSSR